MDTLRINRLFWIINFAGWFIYAFVFYLFLRKGMHNNFREFFLWFITYATGFLVTIPLRYSFRYFSKKYPSINVIAIVVIIGSILGTFVWYIIDNSLSFPLWEEDKQASFQMFKSVKFLFKRNLVSMLILLTWGALYFGIKFFIDYQTEKKQKEEALLLAQRAELEMLRYQLNPHFLFNALNSVRGLIDENTNNAKDMITELSEFLRYTLIHKDVAFVPLSNELEAIKHYLAVEKKRFEEKLDIKYEISKEASNQSVLSLLLHPLVENAVKHGMKNSPLPLKISILAGFENNILIIRICNSGKWIEDNDSKGSTRTGLSNVQRRLKNAYGEKFKFDVQKSDNQVCIKIEIDKNTDA